ncbi:flavin reductase family protein [Kaistia dalseonensis]|uniref:Flavin reductase (DIM6/NTAB) family NADH-FMN oxidoreductase RutF n=1 Tax=Kaistia dalseonensis TaxID=410840 RepID=A0ABU0H8P9_9HYPH|nr:flavin reductase family protein [Kaistia dalseonensis]MCX5495645.1 flavin reductase family protein [Kaistia dalseonensis]MDQ0438238.1 flavin reductase (DIM6/NTAB) family NADH-FMN oxidoreductase RutF [Kaistia dalseonensis]
MERDQFRAGMRKLAGGVTIITARDAEGVRCGLTATAVCSLSTEPPSLLACVNLQSSVARALQGAHHFAVNILSSSHQRVAETFAGRHGLARDARFAHGAWIDGESGLPILADAACSFECELAEPKVFGTHLILIGHVLHTRSIEEDTPPLVYGNGSFLAALAPEFAAAG